MTTANTARLLLYFLFRKKWAENKRLRPLILSSRLRAAFLFIEKIEGAGLWKLGLIRNLKT